jgi:cell pole-organizing protein PopZ
MYERLNGMESTMQEHESVLVFQKEVVEQPGRLIAKTMANQAKVKLHDLLIEGFVQLGEALEKVEAKLKKWHFEQVKNYVSVLDVACQRIARDEETEDDATIKGEARQVKEEGKSTKAVEKGKLIPIDANIVEISDEDETTPLSQFYFQSATKEEHGNAKIGTNQVGASKEQTKGFQRLKVGSRIEGVEIEVRKLIFGITPPQVEHPTLTKRIGIRPYTKNDMLHMMLEMEYSMPVIPVP